MNKVRNIRAHAEGAVKNTQGIKEFSSRTPWGEILGTIPHNQRHHRRNSTPKYVLKISSIGEEKFNPPTEGLVYNFFLISGKRDSYLDSHHNRFYKLAYFEGSISSQESRTSDTPPLMDPLLTIMKK
jgi:hypothetical protein